MATAITVGAGVGAAAVAAALAGAVGLGLLGLAIASHRGGGKGGSKGYGYSSYGGDPSYSGYGYGKRKRRSPEQEAEALENVLEWIRQEDVSGCGLRLVCELGSIPEDELTVKELSILHLVGPTVTADEGLLPRAKASWDYRIARTIGYKEENCSQAYPKCPLAGRQLIEAVMEYIP